MSHHRLLLLYVLWLILDFIGITFVVWAELSLWVRSHSLDIANCILWGSIWAQVQLLGGVLIILRDSSIRNLVLILPLFVMVTVLPYLVSISIDHSGQVADIYQISMRAILILVCGSALLMFSCAPFFLITISSQLTTIESAVFHSYRVFSLRFLFILTTVAAALLGIWRICPMMDSGIWGVSIFLDIFVMPVIIMVTYLKSRLDWNTFWITIFIIFVTGMPYFQKDTVVDYLAPIQTAYVLTILVNCIIVRCCGYRLQRKPWPANLKRVTSPRDLSDLP